MILGYLINLGKSKEEKAFGVLNLPGYNIGNFTIPFVQSFLGPVGVITTSLFDAGNAFVCLGGAVGVADVVELDLPAHTRQKLTDHRNVPALEGI